MNMQIHSLKCENVSAAMSKIIVYLKLIWWDTVMIWVVNMLCNSANAIYENINYSV